MKLQFKKGLIALLSVCVLMLIHMAEASAQSASFVASPTSLNFGNQSVDTSSSSQTVTVSNNGNISGSVTGSSVSGDFASTGSTCGAIMAPGASCTFSINFTPTVAGTRSGTLSISTGATPSPITVALSGVGIAAPVATVPGAPTNASAVGGNAQATVSFSPPTSNGGSAINSYTVHSNPPGGFDNNAGGLDLNHVITGLVNGTTYTFTVTATNNVGTGPASAPTNAVTPVAPPVPPSAPIMGSATGGNTQATVNFSAPTSNGGSPITGYTVTSSPPGGVDSNAGTLALSRNITGLANGTVYTFTVTATNSAGTSPPSAASNPVTPAAPPVPPSAPIMGSASGGDGQAVVNFSAPTSNGGSPITGYTVTSSPPGGVDSNAGTLALSHNITGLVNGTVYTFTVTATNSAGTSPPSAASNPVSPATPPPGFLPPEAPVIGAATAGNAQAVVNFTAPAFSGGTAITGYTVTSNPPGGVDINAGSVVLAHTITGLVNGTVYTFTVTATNGAGTSPSSAPSNAVTPVAPSTTLALSQSSLSFGAQAPNTTSAAQTVTVSNSGSAPLNISGTAISGEFARTDNCGRTLEPGASCSIAVTFTPTVLGPRSGTLSISSNATGSPHSIALSGGSTNQTLSLRPTNSNALLAAPGVPIQLEVLVTDSNAAGVPAVGVAVNWAANAAGDSLSSASSVTDANGRARVNLTLGDAAGPHVVRASSAGAEPYDFHVNSTVAVVLQPATQLSQALLQTAIGTAQAQLLNVRTRLDQIRMLRGSNISSANIKVTAQGTPLPLDQIATALTGKNLSQGRGASGDEFEHWGFFANGNLDLGKQTPHGAQGFELSSRGITMGVDYQINGGHVIGAGLGFAKSNTDLFGDAGKQNATGQSLSLYGSYVPTEKAYMDLAFNHGRNNYNTDRRLLSFDGVTAETANSSTRSQQTAFSITGGADFYKDSLRINPYLRYESVRATVDGFTESGSSLNLQISGLKATTKSFTAGLQTNYAISTSFGVVMPQGRLEFTRQDTNNPNSVLASLANGGSPIALAKIDQNGSFGLVGLGVTVMLARGINGYLNYETTFSKDNASLRRWLMGMSIPF